MIAYLYILVNTPLDNIKQNGIYRSMTLKTKSKQVLDLIAGDPKLSQTDAYQMVHSGNRQTARTNAYKLLRKPEAQIYLQKHVNKARVKIVELVGSTKDEVALNASKDILDREYGKPTQRTENLTTAVNLNLSLKEIINNQS